MKPVLVLALGNPLAGDDAVAHVLAASARADPLLSERADIVCGGTDVFRHAEQLGCHQRVIIVDAALTLAARGTVHAVPHPPPAAERQLHAHALDPVAAINLLRALRAEVAAADIWWLLIDVPEIAIGTTLSPEARRLLPEAGDRLRELILAAAAPAPLAGAPDHA